MNDSIIGKLLLVEDNPGDVRLIQEALIESGYLIELKVITDGRIVIDYLHENLPNQLPDLILLDLNLSSTNGANIVHKIKEDPMLKQIPVVILTISQAERDILQCYSYHANCYVNKPFHIDGFMQLIKSIIDFWFNIATLPRKKEDKGD